MSNIEIKDNKLVLTTEEAQEFIWGGNAGWKTVSQRTVGKRRWFSEEEIIVQHEETGRTFRSHFDEPLTEVQDGGRWEYDEPEFAEVWPHEVTTMEYRNVPPDPNAAK